MKNISAKLVEVMKECSHVLKNGTNSFHGYRYATSSDVLEKVNTALVNNGVSSTAMPELINMVDVTNAKGNTEHMATVKVTIMLTDMESEESVTIVGLGSGQDPGDKAVMKAQTAAIKYAYLLSLNISTGDDPEADNRTDVNTFHPPFPAQQESAPGNQKKSYGRPASPQGGFSVCSTCGAPISEKVRKFSESRYGRPLCMHCQQEAKGIA